ncbi:MAG: hypothetical protein RSB70_05205 [Clostridium sp.]
MKLKEDLKCPICEDLMEEYIYDYNNTPEEKINYKCPNCGHRDCKLIVEGLKYQTFHNPFL